MLSVRFPPDSLPGMDHAAARDALRRSDWAREVLLAALRSGRTLEQIVAALAPAAPAPAPLLPGVARRGLGRQDAPAVGVVRRHCLHPAHLVQHFQTFSQCACGARVPGDPDAPVRPLYAAAPAT